MIEVVGAPGYFVTAAGDVISTIPWRGKARRVLKGSMGPRARYRLVFLRTPGGRRHEYVHRLVCGAFHGPQPPGCEVRHLNGDCLDNRADNVRWGSRQENIADQRTHGTWAHGERSNFAKLTESDVRVIKSRLARGDLQREIAADFGVCKQTISCINTGRSWSHL